MEGAACSSAWDVTFPDDSLLEAAHLEITGKCNLTCSYCYHSGFSTGVARSRELPAADWYAVIDECHDLGCRDFSFSGGEPFLNPHLPALLRYADGKGVERIAVFTNGCSEWSTEDRETISSLETKVEFRISLDGFGLADTVRRGGSYHKIIDRIRSLQRSGHPIVVNTLLNKVSLATLPALFELLRAIPVDKWLVDIPFSYGRMEANRDALWVDLEEAFGVFRDLVLRYLEHPGAMPILEIANVFKGQMLRSPFFVFGPEDSPCAYMRRGVTIRPNGDVCFCPTYDQAFGNVRHTKIADAIRSLAWQSFSSIEIGQITKCRTCRFMPICGAGCRADAKYTLGHVDCHDPVSCQCMDLFEAHILPILPGELRASIESAIGTHTPGAASHRSQGS